MPGCDALADAMKWDELRNLIEEVSLITCWHASHHHHSVMVISCDGDHHHSVSIGSWTAGLASSVWRADHVLVMLTRMRVFSEGILSDVLAPESVCQAGYAARWKV